MTSLNPGDRVHHARRYHNTGRRDPLLPINGTIVAAGFDPDYGTPYAEVRWDGPIGGRERVDPATLIPAAQVTA